MIFSNNAAQEGGAVFLHNSTAFLNGDSILFLKNTAKIGGGLSTLTSLVKTNATLVKFDGNVADQSGGGFSTYYTHGSLEEKW